MIYIKSGAGRKGKHGDSDYCFYKNLTLLRYSITPECLSGKNMKPIRCILIIICLLGAGVSAPARAGVFTDSLDREIVLDRPPDRIVSLAPSLTEILYSLGLGDKVAGVTRFSYYPPEALQKPRVGSYIDLNVEKIISLSPDIVLSTVDGNQPAVIDLLEQAGIPVFVVNPRDVASVMDTIVDIGAVCGIPERAGRLSRELEQRVEHVRAKVRFRESPLVFLQINLRPIMTVNKNTFHQDLIHLAGGRNMSRDEPITYPRISREEVIRKKPDVIIISSMERGGRFEKARQEWLQWTSIPAVQNGRVHLIDSDLIDRPSPRIVDGLEALARIIHPEAGW